VGGFDQSDIRFAIGQGPLLWQPILARIGENRLTPHLRSSR